MTPYRAGQLQALSDLGLTKVALTLPPVGGMLRGAGNWLRQKGPGMLKTVKETLIGQPGQFVNEIRGGTALKPGSMMRSGFGVSPLFGSKLLGGALQYGLPAYQAYSVLKDPNNPNKGEAIGSMAGNMLLGSAMSKPLGLVGSMVAGNIGGRIGGRIGKVFDPAAPQQPPAPEYATQYAPQLAMQQVPYRLVQQAPQMLDQSASLYPQLYAGGQ